MRKLLIFMLVMMISLTLLAQGSATSKKRIGMGYSRKQPRGYG
jgi:hypothetical protein